MFPIIYLITKGNLTSQNFAKESKNTLQVIQAAVRTRVSLIQIREKLLPANLVYQLAIEAKEITKNTSIKILINDRVDITVGANADGVHLPESSVMPTIIPNNLRSNLTIGASTHSLNRAKLLKEQGADFVVLGPVFHTPSKAKYGNPLGLEKLSQICEELTPFPVIAVGGINKQNYQSILKSGASGFASIRFLNNIENLKKLK